MVRLLLRCEPDLDGLLSNASDDLWFGAVSYSTLQNVKDYIERQLLLHLHFGHFGANARFDLLLLYYLLATNNLFALL